MEYASNVWSPSTKINIDKTEMTQRRAARWVKSNYSSYDSVTEMLHDLGWRSLEQRQLDARLIMFYKSVYGLVAIQLPSYLEHPMKITRHMHCLPTGRFILLQITINFPSFRCRSSCGIDCQKTSSSAL